MSIVACVKWVSHPGEPHDERFAGMSPADQSALEFALQQAALLGTGVTVITVGPSGADKVLRDALACGATRAIRIEAPTTAAGTDVATAIADHITDAEWVWCGDYSLDRGAGSVPAFIAAHLGAEQALGVIHIDLAADGVRATRRLDGGRRELLGLQAPAVVSVEGATARLRRAGLASLRSAAAAQIEVVPATTPIHRAEFMVRPYRPRARELAAPAGDTPLDRLRVLTDAGAASVARGEMVALEPADAAARIVQALTDWGYLPHG
ncbi:MAG: hypothetical protein RL238_1993 [Actinomycetota bacterium]|jgi:electron transfer flavoprotein beta subunit